MQGILTYLIWPVVAGIIVLLVEYFVIQPIRKANQVSIPSTVSKDWAKAIKIAVKKFKSQQSDYAWSWLLPNRNTLTLDEWDIQKGQAVIILSVYKKVNTVDTSTPGFAFFVNAPRIVAKYKLVIDRTGDIRKLSSISLANKNQPTYSEILVKELPPTMLAIKNRRVKTEKVPENGTKVTVEFEVENSGKAGKVCPYIEYKVVMFDQSGKYAPNTVFSKPASYEIESLSILPIRFESVYYPPELPLVDSIDKVKIELYPCPNA